LIGLLVEKSCPLVKHSTVLSLDDQNFQGRIWRCTPGGGFWWTGPSRLRTSICSTSWWRSCARWWEPVWS